LSETNDPDEWSKAKLKDAINELSAAGIFVGARIEGRVIWALRNSILIAQVRESVDKGSVRWVIAGHYTLTDHVDAAVAEVPREALRHFCLKWQLGAERVLELDPADEAGREDLKQRSDKLRKQAEDLYEIVEDDTFWS
jgi:hypothetical protein